MIFQKINIAFISLPSPWASYWAIPFLIHTGVWKANSLEVRQKHFPRESKTKIAFPRGSGQVFQRGDDGYGQSE